MPDSGINNPVALPNDKFLSDINCIFLTSSAAHQVCWSSTVLVEIVKKLISGNLSIVLLKVLV